MPFTAWFPLLFVAALVATFGTMVLLARPDGFVRVASIAAGVGVAVFGLAGLGLWLAGLVG